jgi:hypothetical protein
MCVPRPAASRSREASRLLAERGTRRAFVESRFVFSRTMAVSPGLWSTVSPAWWIQGARRSRMRRPSGTLDLTSFKVTVANSHGIIIESRFHRVLDGSAPRPVEAAQRSGARPRRDAGLCHRPGHLPARDDGLSRERWFREPVLESALRPRRLDRRRPLFRAERVFHRQAALARAAEDRHDLFRAIHAATRLPDLAALFLLPRLRPAGPGPRRGSISPGMVGRRLPDELHQPWGRDGELVALHRGAVLYHHAPVADVGGVPHQVDPRVPRIPHRDPPAASARSRPHLVATHRRLIPSRQRAVPEPLLPDPHPFRRSGDGIASFEPRGRRRRYLQEGVPRHGLVRVGRTRRVRPVEVGPTRDPRLLRDHAVLRCRGLVPALDADSLALLPGLAHLLRDLASLVWDVLESRVHS